VSTFRARALHLAVIGLFLAGLAPSPTDRGLADLVRTARSAVAGSDPASALAALEEAWRREPWLGAGLHRRAVRLALDAAQWPSAEVHLNAARGSGDSAEIRCLEWELPGGVTDPLDPTAGIAWNELEACPQAATLLEAEGQAALQRGDGETAREAYRRLVQRLPDRADLRGQYALVLAAWRPDLALADLDLALSQGLQQPEMAESVAGILRAAGRRQSGAETLALVGQVYARHNDWRLARLALARAIELRPVFPAAYSYLGLAYDELGLDGRSLLEEALRQDPLLSLGHFLLGRHWYTRGLLGPAIAEVETALSLSPADPSIAAFLGELYARSGRPQAAEAAFQRAVELAPQAPEFWILLSQFSLANEIKIASVGIPAARQAAVLDGQSPAAWEALGRGHLLLGDLTVAERLLRRSVALGPERVSIRFHLGSLFHLTGRPAEAGAGLEYVVAVGGPSLYAEWAQRALDDLRP
jgi:tetratricopeptide (TPR) repeat protein